MKVKDVVIEDFINYKKPCMFIICPTCNFKCNKEYGNTICQNSSLVNQSTIEISTEYIINKYINNTITKSVVFGGLEPFDSFSELLPLVKELRKVTDDDIVIYTGYNKEEISPYIDMLSLYKNVIIKFGRFVPNQQPHKDEVLGIQLSSDNQYAERISIV